MQLLWLECGEQWEGPEQMQGHPCGDRLWQQWGDGGGLHRVAAAAVEKLTTHQRNANEHTEILLYGQDERAEVWARAPMHSGGGNVHRHRHAGRQSGNVEQNSSCVHSRTQRSHFWIQVPEKFSHRWQGDRYQKTHCSIVFERRLEATEVSIIREWNE